MIEFGSDMEGNASSVSNGDFPAGAELIGPLAADASAPDWIVGNSRIENRTFRLAATQAFT